MDDPQHAVSNLNAKFWDLKNIEFGEGQARKTHRIVMENDNGPHSFITICNILTLRGELEIPAGWISVSYAYLMELMVEQSCSLTYSAMDSALKVMPRTQRNVELTPVFTEVKSFSESERINSFVYLLKVLGIEPVHGWLVDPESPEAEAVSEVGDHDHAVSLIANALLDSDSENPSKETVKTADIIMKFFLDTRSQLTRYGVSQLASTTEPGALMVLYRNFHLPVLYKRDASDDPGLYLYSLVTEPRLVK
ncbi:hypothetical protein BDP27DRAFT_1423367 [Rhodocollybia butyracea]|uniref:MINDY deubiquitinase domain-containing protein n=1 Tax=Rhodocollybia butyracea TaxID=206335 RepID=A0A9P5U5F9_9AGAR|nr:hypothetical protein BDP27DRAFT_1423367 [Rhodocollybia butyracea]